MPFRFIICTVLSLVPRPSSKFSVEGGSGNETTQYCVALKFGRKLKDLLECILVGSAIAHTMYLATPEALMPSKKAVLDSCVDHDYTVVWIC